VLRFVAERPRRGPSREAVAEPQSERLRGREADGHLVGRGRCWSATAENGRPWRLGAETAIVDKARNVARVGNRALRRDERDGGQLDVDAVEDGGVV
jgi:hypothetical protein